jgi:hypothetical protein
MPILEGAGVPPPQQQAFTQWNDPQGTKLIALNRDGTIFCEGVTLDSGATLTFFPNGPVIRRDQHTCHFTEASSPQCNITRICFVNRQFYPDGRGVSVSLLVGFVWSGA